MILWSNLEYVSLRLVRRFLFSGPVLDRIGAYVPYWRVNQGRLDPEPIVTAYQRLARLAGVDITGIRVVELGCGATNGTGHEWTARFSGSWTGVEPFAPFDTELDARIAQDVSRRRPGPHARPATDAFGSASPDASRGHGGRDSSSIPGAVSRVRDLAALDSGSVDLIVSNSVLEHVRDPLACFRECFRVLAPGGAMLHQVDYRDHFFKYPFQFLTFSQAVWDNLLDPGDLPRHRLDDHLDALARGGFQAQVLERSSDPAALAAVAPFLDSRFAARDRDMLATTTAAIACRKPA